MCKWSRDDLKYSNLIFF